MRLAIIDMGTNSIRYSIYEGKTLDSAELIFKRKDMVRPGKGVFTTGEIDEQNLKNLINSFLTWKKISEKYSVKKTIACATCAMRSAKNASEVLKKLESATGYKIEVISGSEEARLIALGILNKSPNLPTRTALVDIGGGSTEISLMKDGEISWSHSLPLGCQRLKQMFPGVNPIGKSQNRKKEIKALRKKITTKLIPLEKAVGSKSRFPHVLGTSGTIKALGRILTLREARLAGGLDYVKELSVLPDNMEFTFTELQELTGQLEISTRATLSFLDGLEDKRRDLIIPGAILFSEICSILKAKDVQTSTASLRDGILLNHFSETAS